jgi:hypothetical protein
MYIENTTLTKFLKTNSQYNSIIFHNYWSNTLDNNFPNEFPTNIYTDLGIGAISTTRITRTKCIHKLDNNIKLISIHGINDSIFFEGKYNKLYDKDKLKLLHFYTWSKSRNISSNNTITNIMTLNIPKLE